MSVNKMRVKQNKELNDVDEVIAQMIKESYPVVKHFQTDLSVDFKRIFETNKSEKTFTLYWVTRKCGTFLFHGKIHSLDEITRIMTENYTMFNIYKIVKDNMGLYTITYLMHCDEEK